MPRWIRIYSREYSVQYSEAAIRTIGGEYKRFISKFITKHVIIPEGPNTSYYCDEKEWYAFESKLMERCTKSRKSFRLFVSEFNTAAKAYIGITKRINRMKLDSMTLKRLKSIYIAYQKVLIRYSLFVWLIYIMNKNVSDKASLLVQHKLDKLSKKIDVDELFNPDQQSGIKLLQDRVRKLKSRGYSSSDIDKLLEEFAWIPCLDIHNKPWKEKDIFDYLKTVKGHEKPSLQTAKSIMQQLKFSRQEQDFFMIVKELAYLKDVRDDYRRQAVFNIQKLFREIASRAKITLTAIAYLTEEEILNFLDTGRLTDREVASRRQKGYLMYMERNKVRCIVGSSVKKVLRAKFPQLSEVKKSDVKDIKGVSASRGEATGRVKIVKGVNDLQKVKNDDIIVAVSTHPDYIIAMQKASAIVTDEGGITSHAAIVARELGIPCIVGARNATKILRDNERIIVNANKGVVWRE